MVLIHVNRANFHMGNFSSLSRSFVIDVTREDFETCFCFSFNNQQRCDYSMEFVFGLVIKSLIGCRTLMASVTQHPENYCLNMHPTDITSLNGWQCGKQYKTNFSDTEDHTISTFFQHSSKQNSILSSQKMSFASCVAVLAVVMGKLNFGISKLK